MPLQEPERYFPLPQLALEQIEHAVLDVPEQLLLLYLPDPHDVQVVQRPLATYFPLEHAAQFPLPKEVQRVQALERPLLLQQRLPLQLPLEQPVLDEQLPPSLTFGGGGGGPGDPWQHKPGP